jgi:hypothetical protein
MLSDTPEGLTIGRKLLQRYGSRANSGILPFLGSMPDQKVRDRQCERGGRETCEAFRRARPLPAGDGGEGSRPEMPNGKQGFAAPQALGGMSSALQQYTPTYSYEEPSLC